MVFYKSNFQYGSMPSQYQNLFEVYDPATSGSYSDLNTLYNLQNFTETESYTSPYSNIRLSDITNVYRYEKQAG